MPQGRLLVDEFVVCVYSDGTVDFDKFDAFLWRLIHQKPSAEILHAPRKKTVAGRIAKDSSPESRRKNR